MWLGCRMTAVLDRLLSRSIQVDRGHSTPCRIWTGAKQSQGYGVIRVGGREGRLLLVHRLAYELLVEPIPADKQMDHLCRQRDCLEIAHLEAVTPQVNTLRGIASQVTSQRHASVTHCPRGHAYAGENLLLRIERDGKHHRQCRACIREREARRRSQASRSA